MSVDVRSSDAETLHRLNRQIESIVRQEASRYRMEMRREEVSKSEPAFIPGHRTSAMALTSEGVWRAFGFDPYIIDTASVRRNNRSFRARARARGPGDEKPGAGAGAGPGSGSDDDLPSP